MRLKLIALAFLSLATSGCSMAVLAPVHQETPPGPVHLTVEISGTPGTTFEGSLGTPAGTRPITGPVPAEFDVTTAVAVAVTVTKKQADGDVTVRVLRAGREVDRRTTAAPYGTVLLVYKP